MIVVGTSGYSYPDWKTIFYPPQLRPVEWLGYYAGQFSSVELNITFYKTPASPVFRHWRERTPRDFRFFLKGSRFATHRKRLRNCHEILEIQFERAAELKDKLAGFLWQLPPRFTADPQLLENFTGQLHQMQTVFGQLRQVFEFRDPSWYTPEIYEILAKQNIALAEPDWPYEIRMSNVEDGMSERGITRTDLHKAVLAGRPIVEVPQTADFRYLRRYGPAARSASPYSPDQMVDLAQKLLTDRASQNTFVYFTNDFHGYALENTRQLISALAR